MKISKVLTDYDRETLEQAPTSKLVDIVLKQQESIQKLAEEVDRLKSLLNKDSQSSSKPPSSDLLKRTEKKPPEATEEEVEGKRKPGAQSGHQGKTRKGFGRVDRYEQVLPIQCPHCGGEEFGTEGSHSRYYEVAQLVERPIEIVQYEQVTCPCQRCGKAVTAALPDSVVAGQDLGASLKAMLVWLGNYGHLSYAKQQEWLREIGGIEIGIGTLQATTARTAKIVENQVEALRQQVRTSTHVQVDESPWLVKGVKEWMWVFAGKGFCLFHAADTRSRLELEEMLGESFAGVLSSDDFSVYNGYPTTAQQKCLAHLRRHFKQVTKLKPASQIDLGNAFIDLIDEAFAQYGRWQTSHDRQSYNQWANEFKERMQETVKQWLPKAGYAASLLLRSLQKKAEQWWYFLDHPEVPPDNNLSERSLRLAVTKRKVCGGSRSMQGFADTATLLSVIQTCRSQGRSALEFLKKAILKSDSNLTLIPANQT